MLDDIPTHLGGNSVNGDVNGEKTNRRGTGDRSTLNSRGGNSRSGSRGRTPHKNNASTKDKIDRGTTATDKNKNESTALDENRDDKEPKKVLFTPDTAFMVMAVLRKGRKDAVSNRKGESVYDIVYSVTPILFVCF